MRILDERRMIGARLSLYPMTDRFQPIIFEAVRSLDDPKLRREIDDVSTFVSGEENALFLALARTFTNACRAARGEHLVMSLTLSRGCPGEPGEDVCDPTATASSVPKEARDEDGLPRAACQFSLYPMGTDCYMDAIYGEIAASANGVVVTPQHLCTRLEGSPGAVLDHLRTAFDRVAEVTPHVVIHATLSANSPSKSS